MHRIPSRVFRTASDLVSKRLIKLSQRSFSTFDFDKVIDRRGTESVKWKYVQGTSQVPLWVADMCFESPPCVIEAVKKRANHGVYGYANPYTGVYDSVLEYLGRIGSPAKEAADVVFLPNVMIGVTLCGNAVSQPGEEVMCMTPVYPPFFSKPEHNDRIVIGAPLVEVNGAFSIDFEAMEASVTPKTKMILLCNPHNPVGRVFRREELEQLAQFCKKHDLIVCSDEIHCDLVFPDSPQGHIPFASISQDAADRTVSLYSASKTYNVAGLTCAYAVITNPELRKAFTNQYAKCLAPIDPNFFGYYALEAAYNEGEDWRQELLHYLQDNRDFVHGFVEEHMPKLRLFNKNEGTYLTWVDASALNVERPQKHFSNHGVMLSPGKPFGGTPLTKYQPQSYDQFVRINFGCPRSMLQEGLKNMHKGYDAAIRNL